jgi:hypothetical protein
VTTPHEAKIASSVQPTRCDFSEGEAMAQNRLLISTSTRQRVPAPPAFFPSRRRPIKQRLILILIGLAIVLLALGGWAAQALRLAR